MVILKYLLYQEIEKLALKQLRFKLFGSNLSLGGGGVQGQGKGQRLMSNIAVNGCIWLATCQGRIYEK